VLGNLQYNLSVYFQAGNFVKLKSGGAGKEEKVDNNPGCL